MDGLPDLTTPEGIIEFLVVTVLFKYIIVHWIAAQIVKWSKVFFKRFIMTTKRDVELYHQYKHKQLDGKSSK